MKGDIFKPGKAAAMVVKNTLFRLNPLPGFPLKPASATRANPAQPARTACVARPTS